MNKHERHLTKMKKYRKRLKNLRLDNLKGNFFSLRSHGAPCSCWVCNGGVGKYRDKRGKEKINVLNE